jgi:hypothetical protein
VGSAPLSYIMQARRSTGTGELAALYSPATMLSQRRRCLQVRL